MSRIDLDSAMDHVCLATLYVYQRRLQGNIKGAQIECVRDDYREQLRRVDHEIASRTVGIAHRVGADWSASEDSRLQRLCQAAETLPCIASTLGRTTAEVSTRAKRFGFSFHDDGTAFVGERIDTDKHLQRCLSLT